MDEGNKQANQHNQPSPLSSRFEQTTICSNQPRHKFFTPPQSFVVISAREKNRRPHPATRSDVALIFCLSERRKRVFLAEQISLKDLPERARPR
jgi:hypothetical protein